MMWTLWQLHLHMNSTHAEIDGEWVPARPISHFRLWSRLKQAWAVFIGKADSFTWPKGQ